MPARPKPKYEVLPDVDLQPSHPVHGVDVELQAESMRKLRAMHNTIAANQIERDRQMQAWALSNSLSRHDMAVAVGMHKSRVDQIIRELTLHDERIKAREIIERNRRHMTPELFEEWLAHLPESDGMPLIDSGDAVHEIL